MHADNVQCAVGSADGYTSTSSEINEQEKNEPRKNERPAGTKKTESSTRFPSSQISKVTSSTLDLAIFIFPAHLVPERGVSAVASLPVPWLAVRRSHTAGSNANSQRRVTCHLRYGTGIWHSYLFLARVGIFIAAPKRIAGIGSQPTKHLLVLGLQYPLLAASLGFTPAALCMCVAAWAEI